MAKKAGLPESEKRAAAKNERIQSRVRNLLADRFQLKLREEIKELPMYGLTVDKTGHKLKPAEKETGSSTSQNNSSGKLNGSLPLKKLAEVLGQVLKTNVVDETGLEGPFEFGMEWNEEEGPSLFTAVKQQLGLRLESRKGPVQTFVIVSVEKPSEN